MQDSLATALLKKVVLPIIATGVDGSFDPIGSGFIISTLGRQALMLSAAHSFEQIVRLDNPYSVESIHGKPINLRYTQMHALYPDNSCFHHFAKIRDVRINNPADIALCVLYLDDGVPEEVNFEKRIAIDTAPIANATPVKAIGYCDMSRKLEIDEAVGEARAVYRQQLETRSGNVIAVYRNKGPRNQPWPCFQCDIPFDSGMSGGPIINRSYGNEVVACGIVCSDSSHEITGRASGLDAIAAMLWPAMGIRIKDAEVDGVPMEPMLLDLQREGWIDDKGNACQHLGFDEDKETGYFRMHWD